VREAEMKARIEYVTLMPEEPVQIGSATSHALPAQPPGDQLWVTASNADGKSVFFTGDHEPPYNIYDARR
jgi:hypothetical protein